MRKYLDLWEKKTERFLNTDIRYLTTGGWWLFFGQGVSIAASFVLAIAFANLLSKQDYGTYKYILSLIGLLSLPALSGMGVAVLQSVAKGETGAYLSGLRAKLRWGALGSVGALMAGGYYFFMGNLTIGISLLAAAPLIPLVEGYALWGSYLGGKKLFKAATLRNSIVQVGTAMVTLTLILTTKNVTAIIIGYLTSYAILRIIIHRNLSKKFPDMVSPGDAEEAMRFGKNSSFFSLFGSGVAQLDSFLLWHFLGPVALATYAFAQATTTPAKTFMKSIVNLAQPKFSEKETATLKSTIHRKVFRSYLFMLPVTIAYIAVLPLVYEIFFPKYAETIPYAQVLGLIFLFFPMKLYSVAITTRDDKQPTYILNTINPIIFSVLMLILIPFFGIWGAVASILLEYVITTGTSLYFFRKLS